VRVETSGGGVVPLSGLSDLNRYLRECRANSPGLEAVQIQADSKLKYAFVTAAMDSCLTAGCNRVGFAPPPDLGR
jgi:biopolymer transport protein ExbD